MVNGIRQQIAPPKGSKPPSPLAITSAPGVNVSQSNRLGSISRPYKFSAGLTQLTLSDGNAVGGRPWAKVKVPRSSHSLLLCWRKHGAPNWDDAETKFLPDHPRNFGPLKLRFVNISNATVEVKFGKERLAIQPKKGKMLTLKKGKNPLIVKMKDKRGNAFTLYDNIIDVDKSERVNAIIYKADGRKPRRPCKVFVQKETARAYQPPRSSES